MIQRIVGEEEVFSPSFIRKRPGIFFHPDAYRAGCFFTSLSWCDLITKASLATLGNSGIHPCSSPAHPTLSAFLYLPLMFMSVSFLQNISSTRHFLFS
jgi:hypothetical protein